MDSNESFSPLTPTIFLEVIGYDFLLFISSSRNVTPLRIKALLFIKFELLPNLSDPVCIATNTTQAIMMSNALTCVFAWENPAAEHVLWKYLRY